MRDWVLVSKVMAPEGKVQYTFVFKIMVIGLSGVQFGN